MTTATMDDDRLRPFCAACCWRMGGPDSWNGAACKCGHSRPPLPTPGTMTLLGRAHVKGQARRFSGAPLTGFGDLL
jgi:hypothetical protein